MRLRLLSLARSLLPLLVLGACGTAGGTQTQSTPAPARTPAPAPQVETPQPAAMEDVEPGRFDNGKMWTFEYPPLEYFSDAYGFDPDSAWFEDVRLAALRLPNCSASFVSPNGLVLTNHHCARESVTKVSREGENLLDNGFYAANVSEERPVDGLHADQLIAIHDATDEVLAAMEGKQSDAERTQAREQASQQVLARLKEEHGGEEAGIVTQMIALWNGAKYSAYVFRRYDDLRLVMAPELQLGYFGGDTDNFTYPRYALDMSFFRIYDGNGDPLNTAHHFSWTSTGVEQGAAVFVIGNPGSTSRLATVAQLEYRRDVRDKAILDLLSSRVEALRSFADENPEKAEELDLRNTIFSLLNSEKAFTGMLSGLRDPAIIARRRAAQEEFRAAIQADPELRAEYGGLFDRMASIQQEKRRFAAEYGAFLAMGSPSLTAAAVQRGLFALQYLSARAQGAPDQALDQLAERIRSVGEQPLGLQQRLLTARLEDFVTYFGQESGVVQQILQDRSPEAAARAALSGSELADSAAAAKALESGTLTKEDPVIGLVEAFMPRFRSYQGAFQSLNQREEEVERQLGRARFHVYGTSVPPDATFSLRIADGRVRGYEYNGTVAPVYTTFYGLYDHFYSYGPDTEWELPGRWLAPPSAFDLATPLNFVSTADVIGGNSGSPVIDTERQLVGVIFDGNIESLPGDYIYVPEHNRSVAVDARGMLESLDDMYDADRIVLELTTGRLVPSEAEADAAMTRK